jgi:hypothetical protein
MTSNLVVIRSSGMATYVRVRDGSSPPSSSSFNGPLLEASKTVAPRLSAYACCARIVRRCNLLSSFSKLFSFSRHNLAKCSRKEEEEEENCALISKIRARVTEFPKTNSSSTFLGDVRFLVDTCMRLMSSPHRSKRERGRAREGKIFFKPPRFCRVEKSLPVMRGFRKRILSREEKKM